MSDAIGDALLAAIDGVAQGEDYEIYRRDVLRAIAGVLVPKWAMVALAVDQTTNLSVNNHIEFDKITGPLNGAGASLSIGSGQSDGIITLAEDRTFLVSCWLGAITSAAGTGVVRTQWRDNSDDSAIVGETTVQALEHWLADTISGGHASLTPASALVIKPTGDDLAIKLDLLNVTGISQIEAGSRVFIQEIYP